MLPQPPKIQLDDIVDPEDSPGQASNSLEGAIESETSTEGKGDVFHEAVAWRLIKHLPFTS